ncbi:hypothetical protein [Bradyrhizobium sp. DASA03007]|uniref:hypothetical protein n=1 Tax=unclassified Bradyrhizobium TaxID=2631580 RepID=UPI003F7156BF
MKHFLEGQSVLAPLPVLLLLGGCAGTMPECNSLDARNTVIKIVSGDSNNALVNYAVMNSSAVAAMISHATTEAEKLAIWEKARQGAAYRLDDATSTNSRSKAKRAVTCTALLSATVEDVTAQKEVDFEVELTADGKISVSVSPFQF